MLMMQRLHRANATSRVSNLAAGFSRQQVVVSPYTYPALPKRLETNPARDLNRAGRIRLIRGYAESKVGRIVIRGPEQMPVEGVEELELYFKFDIFVNRNIFQHAEVLVQPYRHTDIRHPGRIAQA